MSWTLKPGEKLIRWWKPKLGKFEGRDKRALIPSYYANGRLIWEPDLDEIDMVNYIDPVNNVATKWQKGGEGPAIQVDYPQDDQYGCPSRVKIPIISPYPVVGGRFSCTLLKDTGSVVSMFYGEPGLGEGQFVYL